MMKAVRIGSYGGPEVLEVGQVPIPCVVPGHVLVRVEACAVNPLDAWFRSGHLASRFPRPLPYTPGQDVVGSIVDCAADVGSLQPGDRVAGVLPLLSDGGCAEFVAAEAGRWAVLPDHVDTVSVAAALTPGTTGLQLLDKALSVVPGARILLLGALGAVGRAVLAAAADQDVCMTAVVRPGREAECLSLGARYVEPSDDVDRIAELHGAFDVIIDTAGPALVSAWQGTLAQDGVALTTVPLPRSPGLREHVDVISFAFSPDPGFTARVAGMVGTGRLGSPPIEQLSLDQAAFAHEAMADGRSRKFVIVPGGICDA